MLDRIINILKDSEIKVWRVTESVSKTSELYFIKKKLDIPRIKEMTQYVVTVYNDFEKNGQKFRGDSNVLLSVGMDDEEISKRLKSGYLAASFVANPFYELADPVSEEKKYSKSDLAKMNLEDEVIEFSKALFEADNNDKAFVNSAEIYANKESIHIVASNGLDVSFDKDSISGELVTQAKEPVDVEQFRQFAFDSFNTEGIKKIVNDALRDVCARAEAKEPPKKGTYNILLTGEHIAEVLSFYAERSSAAMIFPGYSKWAIDNKVQGEDISGEKLNLSLESNSPYSMEGIPLPKRALVEKGVLKLVHGSTRFCRYLGITPTGDYGKIVCDNGETPIENLRKAGTLEPVSFSDFQMDSFDGHFKGEIRLAYLYKEDGSVETVTGGSINGSLLDCQKDISLSKERYSDLSYEGPLGMLFKDVLVAGK